MIRILKAFAWIRWRMLINALDRTGSRDALERFSLAMEKLGPIIAAVLLIPSALALFAMGLAAGVQAQDVRELSFGYDQPKTTGYGFAGDVFEQKLEMMRCSEVQSFMIDVYANRAEYRAVMASMTAAIVVRRGVRTAPAAPIGVTSSLIHVVIGLAPWECWGDAGEGDAGEDDRQHGRAVTAGTVPFASGRRWILHG